MAQLDNPLWSSLTTLHAALAVTPSLRDGAVRSGEGAVRSGEGAVRSGEGAVRSGEGAARWAAGVARYPADVAPFLALEHDGAHLDAALTELVLPGDSVLCIGPRPVAPAGWRLEDLGVIIQMVCDPPAQQREATPAGTAVDPEIVEITARADILALARLVYPHYFRPRTPVLGRYVGVYRDGQLVAMAGERMGWPGAREVSAVCTHPAYVGKGLARRLMAHLVADLARSGTTAFLHVAPTNTRARQLYAQNGWRARRDMPFCALHRP